MINWKIKFGKFLFKYRSFTPIPLILLVVIIFPPVHWGTKSIQLNLLGIFISILGETIRIIAVGYSFAGTSGREDYLKADSLNTTGIYSIVRNPLYIGNFFMFIGILIIFSNIFASLIFSVFLILQYYFIILAEENYLLQTYGQSYRAYFSEIRRVIPGFRNFKKNQNPFNLKKVIFKENDSIFNMIFMILLILIYKEWRLSGNISQPLFFGVSGGIIILAYLLIKILKKKKYK